MLTAVKKAEDTDGLIFRLYEWAGKNGEVEINLPPGAKSATMTDLMEKPVGAPLKINIRTRLRFRCILTRFCPSGLIIPHDFSPGLRSVRAVLSILLR